MRLTFGGLRLLPISLLALATAVSSRPESLFTSSVSYCSPPQAILVQQFDVEYVAANSSVFFNVSASSVQSGLNVSANLMLNVYGLHFVNLTIDLCSHSILGGALCPLPTYNFTGSQWLQLPSSLDVSSEVPGIAYKIPDLEAFAQLTLIEVGTGAVKACVQSTLSNGWSTRQGAVQWATAALLLVAFLMALAVSARTLLFSSRIAPRFDFTALTIPRSISLYRLQTLMTLYASIAFSGLLTLNPPVLYRSFTLNFAWALGLFSVSSASTSTSLITSAPSSQDDSIFSSSVSGAIQNAINTVRHKTGGTMMDASTGSAVDLVNRALSPYNILPTGGTTSSGVGSSTSLSVTGTNFASFVVTNSTNINLNLDELAFTSTSNFVFGATNYLQVDTAQVETVTASSSNVLDAGIPVYVNYLGIATANAFFSVFITALIVMASWLAAAAIGFGVLEGWKWREKKKNGVEGGIRGSKIGDAQIAEKLDGQMGEDEVRVGLRERFLAFALSWGLILCLIIFPPLLTFIFYQWTLKDSWLSILLSVLALILIGAAISYPTLKAFFVLRRQRPRPSDLSINAAAEEQGATSPTLRKPSDVKFDSWFGKILYGQYKVSNWRRIDKRLYFFLPLLSLILKSVVIAFAHGSGLAQMILITLIDLISFISIIIIKPYGKKSADVLEGFLAGFRVGVDALLFAFVQRFDVKPIPRVVVGVIAAVVWSVCVIIMFFNLVVNLGVVQLGWVWVKARLGFGFGKARRGGDVDEDATSQMSVPSREQERDEEDEGKGKANEKFVNQDFSIAISEVENPRSAFSSGSSTSATQYASASTSQTLLQPTLRGMSSNLSSDYDHSYSHSYSPNPSVRAEHGHFAVTTGSGAVDLTDLDSHVREGLERESEGHRPSNPTPEQMIPMERGILEPYASVSDSESYASSSPFRSSSNSFYTASPMRTPTSAVFHHHHHRHQRSGSASGWSGSMINDSRRNSRMSYLRGVGGTGSGPGTTPPTPSAGSPVSPAFSEHPSEYSGYADSRRTGSTNTTTTSVGNMLPRRPIFEGLPGISSSSPSSVELDLNDDDSGYGEGGDRDRDRDHNDDSDDTPYNSRNSQMGGEDKRSEGKMPLALAFAQGTPPPVKNQKQALQVIGSRDQFLDGLRSSPTATLIFGERSVELSR